MAGAAGGMHSLLAVPINSDFLNLKVSQIKQRRAGRSL
jgi:hypothetical protein